MAVKKFTPPKNTNKKTFDISELRKEKDLLEVSRDDLKRLAEVKAVIDHFDYGIIKKDENKYYLIYRILFNSISEYFKK